MLVVVEDYMVPVEMVEKVLIVGLMVVVKMVVVGVMGPLH